MPERDYEVRASTWRLRKITVTAFCRSGSNDTSALLVDEPLSFLVSEEDTALRSTEGRAPVKAISMSQIGIHERFAIALGNARARGKFRQQAKQRSSFFYVISDAISQSKPGSFCPAREPAHHAHGAAVDRLPADRHLHGPAG